MELTKKIMLWILATFLMIGSASALSCTFAEQPSFTHINNIYWNCLTTKQTTCYSYIKFNDQLIQARPYPSQQKDTNTVIEGFDCNGVCNVKFDNVDLRHNKTLLFGVQCEGDTYEKNITPQYSNEYTSETWISKLDWAKNNAHYLLFALIIFFSILATIGLMIKIINNKN